MLVGLTGSIGMGKSETAKLFARLGVPVYDSDAAVHRLYEPGGAAVEPIGAAFPGAVVSGRVDRKVLSDQIAGKEEAFRQLEGIVHPLVAAEQRRFLDENKDAELAILDIPLLFETGGAERMDAVVVVSAPAHVQRERVLSREGMTPAKLDQILSRQVPDAEKRAKAHFVVETDKGLEHAFAQVKAIVEKLRAKRNA